MYRAFNLKPHYSYYFNVIKIPRYRQSMVKFITKNKNMPVVYVKNVKYWVTIEYYFLFMCKRLKALKSKYISCYFWTKPSINKRVELFSSEHSKTIINLAILVYFGLKVFANL